MRFDLNKEILEIMSVIKDYGEEAYVVGGCVRDSIMGREPHDWDICTSAKAEELLTEFKDRGYKVVPTGLKYGTITVYINGNAYEITTFRKDGDYTDGRHPDKVNFTSDLVCDLERRDFTINAMAYNPEVGLVDPFNGVADIKDKTIRCVGCANERFNEDALRVLRAIRFAAQLGFNVASDTDFEIHRYKKLENVSIERITAEFCKIAVSPNFHNVLFSYKDVFTQFIPELGDMDFPQNNPYHDYDVFNHTVHALENCDSDDLLVRLAVLFHDFGKPHSYQDGEDGIRHFKGHGKVSANITESIMRRLKFDSKTRDAVVELVYHHDATIELGKKYVKRWLNKMGEEQLRRLLTIRKADIKGQKSTYDKARIEKVYALERLIDEVMQEQECFSLKDLAVNGNDVKEVLHLKAGRNVGYWLDELLDKVITGELNNTREDLISWMLGQRAGL